MNGFKSGGKNGMLHAVFCLSALSCLLIPASCARDYIINVHEHIESVAAAKIYLQAAQSKGISKTVLLGSPEATFNPKLEKFSGTEKNNEVLFQIDKQFPGSFVLFPAVDLNDPQKRLKVKEFAERGAKGIKVYGGHQQFHSIALDDVSLDPFYSECSQHRLVLMLHVNTGLYSDELEGVLKKHPHLNIICPHYCLSTIRTERLEHLMRNYPQLYTDVSFGKPELLIPALQRFSGEPSRYQEIIEKFQDRILFGTDLVVMDKSVDTQELATRIQSYRDLLEQPNYTYKGIEGTLKGLALKKPVLNKIYRENAEKLLMS